MALYKNKYRIASARAPWWDYGWAAPYFITICTQDREHYFGDIINGSMRLTHAGVLADILCTKSPTTHKTLN
jgi:putative transposase